MASSRRSVPAEGAAAAAARVDAALAGTLAAELPPGVPFAVALSGGRDSIALLDAAAPVAVRNGRRMVALHVHHGLSAEAGRWLDFCAQECAARGVPFEATRIAIEARPPTGIESAARTLRYDALAAMATRAGVRHVLLAHHQDDQAETLLLQLARGAGPHGLGAMAKRREHGGIVWLRPLLDLPRADLETYVALRDLRFVDDASNGDVRFRRNAVRETVVPAWRRALPGYPGTLARAASLQAAAARLADDLAVLDAGDLGADRTLDRARLAGLPPHRASNLLRWFLREHGLRPPSAARTAAMLRALACAAPDARIRLMHDGAEVGVHGGRIIVHGRPPPPFALPWRGERELHLPHGVLAFVPAVGDGLSLARVEGRSLVVRSRRGGERIVLARARPRRPLKRLLQEAGIPPWQRAGLPLVFVGETLVAVPGVGIAPDFQAQAHDDAVRLDWRPRDGR